MDFDKAHLQLEKRDHARILVHHNGVAVSPRIRKQVHVLEPPVVIFDPDPTRSEHLVPVGSQPLAVALHRDGCAESWWR